MSAARSSSLHRDRRLVAGVVAHLPLLAGVDAQRAAALAERCWSLQPPRGEAVVRRHTRLPGIFAVAYGTVKLSLGRADGEQRVLRLVTAGQTFGEASALLGRPADYDALTMGECKLVVMPTAPILELAEHDARFAHNLMMVLARRTVDLLTEVRTATLHSGAQRLAAYLDSLAADHSAPGPLRIELPASKTLIASRLGVKKETLSRLLRQLSSEGMISVGRREIAILDPQRLAALARA
ncbi:MAG TPA: Crp/Fnr family transcriptional regulator [Burkholderiales bacterium]|nr:Crp/Fnr family transcriptional regulator [Burkholderiales bacterium]